MRLGIISDCIHYKAPDGRVGTENHILLRQLEALASHFDQTTIACPFATTDNTKVITWYTSKISFHELPVVGGDEIKDKIKLLTVIPKWFTAFKVVDKASDVVYQRFPNNLNIPGFFYYYFKSKKVFATYTGTWLDYPGEPATYKLQKWFLQKLFKGSVWVYTDERQVDKRIKSGFSPSYSEAEWNEEEQQVASRIDQIQQKGLEVFRLITVGTLISYKNQLTILKACLILREQQFPFYLRIVGHGPMFEELQAFIAKNNLQNQVELCGKKNHSQLRELYRNSDFVVQAPLKEGFGKVPIEGFFHGVVPVLSNLTMAKYMTGTEERGFLFNGNSASNLAETLISIRGKQNKLPQIIMEGRKFAQQQTLERWANEYYATVSYS